MNSRNVLLAVALATALFGGAANAGTDALKVGLSGDRTDVLPAMNGTRLVTFRYSPEVSFAVRAMKDTFVNIEVPEGEVVQGFYLSDGVQWTYHVTGDNRRVLVKPLDAGLVNTGTLITDKRSYELTMISVPPGEMWFQRVRWQVPGAAGGDAKDGMYWRGQMRPSAAAAGAPLVAVAGGDAAPIDPTRMHFNYRVHGKAPFAPTAVFDDGVRTWIKFGDVQDLPAVFAEVSRGSLEVVDYSVQGPYIVIPSMARAFVLRLRNQEVRVERRG